MRNRIIYNMPRSRGITLTEVIIVSAIIGILAAIIWPVYQGQTYKGRRAEVIADMGMIKVFMERCYADNGGYSCCDIDAFIAATPPPIPPARTYSYTRTLTDPDPTPNLPDCKEHQGYTVTATPTGRQADDTRCASFSMTHLGTRTATNNACWGD